MAGLVLITQALENRMRVNIASLGLTDSAVHWPNTSFIAKERALWARPTVRVADEISEVLVGDGSATGETMSGLFIIQVFQSQNAGSGAANACADAIKTLFNKRIIALTGGGTLHTFEAVREPIGDDGFGWYQVNVTTRWAHFVH